jgi:hypothetical protein
MNSRPVWAMVIERSTDCRSVGDGQTSEVTSQMPTSGQRRRSSRWPNFRLGRHLITIARTCCRESEGAGKETRGPPSARDNGFTKKHLIRVSIGVSERGASRLVIAAARTRLWLASGLGRPSLRLSTTRRSPGTLSWPSPCHPRVRSRVPFLDTKANSTVPSSGAPR